MTAEELEKLPLETRLLRFHEHQEDALQRAAKASTEAERAKFLAFAKDWAALAKETERLLRERHQKPSS